MRTIPGRPSSVGGVAARLLAAGALLALGACAEAGDPPRPMASISPLELVGLSVQQAEADRILGTVDDVVVVTPNLEPVQILVASGSPVYPVKRRVVVDTDYFRYSSERQALLLTGMSLDQFAALPPITGNGPPVPLPGAGDATNWYRATAPGPALGTSPPQR